MRLPIARNRELNIQITLSRAWSCPSAVRASHSSHSNEPVLTTAAAFLTVLRVLYWFADYLINREAAVAHIPDDDVSFIPHFSKRDSSPTGAS